MTNTLSDRYQAALARAFELHQGHYRKGSRTPYLSHLLIVSALVLENKGNEDQAIAALRILLMAALIPMRNLKSPGKAEKPLISPS
jgi:(p)ppGpp synthase/HD superfamily hydrolase